MILTEKEILEIISEIEKANLIEENNLNDALKIYLNLWDKLPSPKEQQPDQIANWLVNCIFGVYFDTGNYLEAKKWAKIGLKYRKIKYSTNEYVQIGMVCYELKDEKAALEHFTMAYQLGEKRAFQGIDKKYWKFYSENKKISPAKILDISFNRKN